MTDRYVQHAIGSSHGVLDITTRIFYSLPSIKDMTPEQRKQLITRFENGHGERDLVGLNLITRQPVLPTYEPHAAIARRVLNSIGFNDV